MSVLILDLEIVKCETSSKGHGELGNFFIHVIRSRVPLEGGDQWRVTDINKKWGSTTLWNIHGNWRKEKEGDDIMTRFDSVKRFGWIEVLHIQVDL